MHWEFQFVLKKKKRKNRKRKNTKLWKTGMCFDPYGMAMEYVAHGNLYEWLRKEGNDGGKDLGWEMRMRVAMNPFLLFIYLVKEFD